MNDSGSIDFIRTENLLTLYASLDMSHNRNAGNDMTRRRVPDAAAALSSFC